ncbi:MAG: porin [Halieaceae bacterium]
MKGFGLLSLIIVAATAQADDKQRLAVSGRAFVDADYYESFWSSDGDDSNSGVELRNGRIQLDYDFPKGWEGKLQVNVEADEDDEDIGYGSVYLRYTKWKPADITLGRLKEPVGLELNTGSSKLQTIERSMVTTAFTAGKSWGVHLFDANKHRRWALAAVIEDDQDGDYGRGKRDFDDPPMAVAGRYTMTPINTDVETLHLGFSATLRDWRDNTFRIGSRAEVGSADRVVRSAEFQADSQALLGVEGLYRLGGWQVQAEYMATRVEEVDGPDWDYDGYYITGSYLLGDVQRKYRSGEFRRLTPDAGLWEFVARYSYLNARDRGLGARAAVTTLGVNYYASKSLRLMLAFLHPDISGSVRHADPDGNALSARVQLNF